jgi:hypothetical protein
MDYLIVEQEIDMAGKFRIKVDLLNNSNNLHCFKFNIEPTDEMIVKAIEEKLDFIKRQNESSDTI